ncbi:MAG: flagellar protein FlaG [Syntrophothermus sp.]
MGVEPITGAGGLPQIVTPPQPTMPEVVPWEGAGEVQAKEAQAVTAERGNPPSKSTKAGNNQEEGIFAWSKERFEELLNKLNITLNAMDIQARFSVHKETGDIMVRIINVETGKTIREVPPEKLLEMAAKLKEMVGLIVDEKV